MEKIENRIWHSACIYLYMKIIKLLIGLALGIGVLSCEIEDTCYDCDTIVINDNDELDCKIIDCE